MLLAGLALACIAVQARAQVPTVLDEALARATDAVRDTFGVDAEVTLDAPVLHVLPRTSRVTRAVAEPSSRTAGPVRFVLYGPSASRDVRVGRLTARVRVSARHVRAVGALRPRSAFTETSVIEVREDIGRQLLAPLPTLAAVIGATSRKSFRDGDVVTHTALVARPLVASGDEVVTVARIGGLEIRGRAIAAQAAGLGDPVIVVNPDSRRRLHGRVRGQALVEVMHGS